MRERLGERFDIEALIGAGGMGRVYRARDRTLGRVVAIKAVNPSLVANREWVDRLAVEARIIARLHHPNVVQVYEVLDVERWPLLVLEYVEGTDLREAVRRGRLGREELVGLMTKVCHAVAYAHGQGVIHHDIKPANIMLTTDGEPKVMDFGIAGLSDESDADSSPAAGSPAFMAPELFDGGGGDTRSDIYALGVTLYYCLAGRLPFPGRHGAELIDRIRRGDAPPLTEVEPRVPRDLVAICAKAMAVQPGERYRTALEMARDLERALEGRPVSARRYSLREQLVRSLARRKLGFASACLAVVLLFGGVALSASHVHTVSEATILAGQEDKIRNIAFTIASLMPRAGAVAGETTAAAVTAMLDGAIRKLKAFNPDIRDAYLVAPVEGGAAFEVVAAWHESSAATGMPVTVRGHDTWGSTPRVANAEAERFMRDAAAGQILVQHEFDADQQAAGNEWNQRLLGYAPIGDEQGVTHSVLVIEVTSEAVAKAFGQIEEAFRLTVTFGLALSIGLLFLSVSGMVLLWRQSA